MGKDYIPPVEGEDKNSKGDVFHYGRNGSINKHRKNILNHDSAQKKHMKKHKPDGIYNYDRVHITSDARSKLKEFKRTEVYMDKLRDTKLSLSDNVAVILDHPTNDSVYEKVNAEISKMHKAHLVNDEPIKNLNIYRNKRWNKPKNIYKKFYPKAEPKPALTPTGKKPFTDLLEYLSACKQLNIKPILSYRPLGLSKSYLTISLANFEYDQERIYKKTGDKVVHTYFMKDIVKYGEGRHEPAIEG